MKPRSKDYDLRAALVASLLADGIARRDIRHEITLDTSSSGGRLDVLLLHRDELHGIEIKSGTDRLDRLREQERAARCALDYTSVLVDVRHYDKASAAGEILYWCPDARQFMQVLYGEWSAAAPHVTASRWFPSNATSVIGMARLMWRDEAVAAVRRLAGATCPPATRRAALAWIKEEARLKDLRIEVAAALRGRTLNRWETAFWSRYDADPSGGSAQPADQPGPLGR